MEPPVVGLLAKYVSAGRGRLVHRRKTKESGKFRQSEAYSGRLSPECQRPCSKTQNGEPYRAFRSVLSDQLPETTRFLLTTSFFFVICTDRAYSISILSSAEIELRQNFGTPNVLVPLRFQ